MNLNDIQQYIITDVNEFWSNTINPLNRDAIFSKRNMTSPKDAIKVLGQPINNAILKLFNTLTHNFYLLKDEYLVASGGVSIITNKRLYILDQKELSIPINTITFCGYENGQLVIKYLGETGEKTYFIIKPITIPAIINNHVETFKNDPDLDNQVIKDIISTPKVILTPSIPQPAQIAEIKEYKQPKSYKGVVVLCIILLFIGGCFYFVNTKFGNSNSAPETRVGYDSATGKKMKKCPWCGGIGRVGYAGDSKAQVDRTGMGLGNPCTTCNGTGYVKDDDK